LIGIGGRHKAARTPIAFCTGMQLYERSVRGALRAYKLTVSPLIGPGCRFTPTCSEYAAQALIAHGPWRGSWLAARRVCRCHPWGGSGYDPPPPKTM
jgi:putative membrane protein insertion efficiency factor